MDTSYDQIVFFLLNGIQLSLYQREKMAEDALVESAGEGFKSFTLSYNAHNRKEVDDLVSNLEKLRVRIVKKPQEVFGGGYSGYIADTDYNFREIAYNLYLPLDENGNSMKTKKMG